MGVAGRPLMQLQVPSGRSGTANSHRRPLTNLLKSLVPKLGIFGATPQLQRISRISESNVLAKAARPSPAFGHTPRERWAFGHRQTRRRIVRNSKVVEGRALETNLLKGVVTCHR